MKKLLVFLVMFSLMGVIAVASGDNDDQTVNLEVDPVIDISVDNLAYGNIVPGNTANDDSEITVNTPNNVPLTITISITDAGLGDIFNDIDFDLTAFGLGVVRIGDGPQDIDVDDDTGTTNIPTSLDILVGTPAGTKTGTINYIAMQRV